MQSAPEGFDAILKCRPVGDPRPIISSWQRNGKDIKCKKVFTFSFKGF